MSVGVFNAYRRSCKDIDQSRKMSLEVEVILAVCKIKSDVYCLISQHLFEEELLICYDNTLVASVSYSRVSAVDTSKLDDVFVKRNVAVLCHIIQVETRAEIIVGIVFFSAFYAVFTSVVNRRNTGHCVHKSVYQRQMSVIAESACETVYIVIIDEVVKVDIAVDTAVCT